MKTKSKRAGEQSGKKCECERRQRFAFSHSLGSSAHRMCAITRNITLNYVKQIVPLFIQYNLQPFPLSLTLYHGTVDRRYVCFLGQTSAA